MSRWPTLFSRRKRMMEDLNQDIRDFIERETQDNIDRGMPPEEARYAALRKFGNVTRVKEETWEVWSFVWLEQLWQDVRFGVRMLAKNPGFTAVAVLTLALGIGANTAVFTMVDAVALRPLPASSPDRLVRLYVKSPQGVDPDFSYPDYEDIRQQVRSLSGVAAYYRSSRFLNSLDESSRVLIDDVSPDYFTVLGVKPLLGRTFSRKLDGGVQSETAVVLSYRLWQSRMAGDAAIIGKEIKLNGERATVIGVTPPHFQGVERIVPTDMWLLIGRAVEFNHAYPAERNDREFETVARLSDGMTIEQARSELDAFGHRLAAAYPETNRGITFQLIPETKWEGRMLPIGLLLMAVVGLVLVIACANVAGLLLARAEGRRREFAVRVALGAGRRRLARQALTEGLLLSTLGGALGFALTCWLMSFQRVLMPPALAFLGPEMQVDLREVAFTAGVTLAATLLSTLTSAFRAWRVGLAGVLKGEEVTLVHWSHRLTARNLMVAGQIALSVILMTMSALFLRSLYRARNLPVGFDTHKNLAVVNVFALQGSRQRPQQYLPLLAERAAGLPGVKRAAYAFRIPLSGSGSGMSAPVSIPGYQLPEGQSNIPIYLNAVSPQYFQTVGTRILQGRAFTSADGPESQKVAIISQTMARRFWPHGDAVGQSIKVGKENTLIVGIAEDVKISETRELPVPYMYLPYSQTNYGDGAVIVETGNDPAMVISLLRREIHSYSQELAIAHVDNVQSLLDLSTLDLMFEFRLIGILSLVGVFLAALGLYGVVAFIVGSRTREIGIRLALGAGPQQVKGVFLLQGLRLALTGVCVGVLAALAAGRLVAGLIYGVKPYDPVSMAASAAAVTGIALLACYLPARRATMVDPMVALRYE
jgi:putative ABC transport system permease protein